jgi:ribosomal protein S12 methylthiotransferase accessory factor
MNRQTLRYPIAGGAIVADGPRAVCHLQDRTVEIAGPTGLLRELLSRCDGVTPLEEIIDDLAMMWDAGDVSTFVERLRSENVLVDSHDVANNLWSRVKNPQCLTGDSTPEELLAAAEHAAGQLSIRSSNAKYFTVRRTPLNALLARRRSARQFSRAEVPLADILSALWSAYGLPHRRSVPSAGGIYPLQIHLLQLRASPDLQAGAYRVSFHEKGEVGLEHICTRIDDAYAAWINPSILMEAQGAVVISGDFARTAAKYGNRAALFVPLEAGHAAQNLLLAACELQFGVVELGGFLEDRLSQLLMQSNEVMPLLTIAYGAIAEETAVREVDNVDFRWVDTGRNSYCPPLFIGAAMSEAAYPEWCWGWSSDSRLAYTKALAETCERTACATPRGLRFARYTELDHALLPTRIAAYSDAQYRRADFPFNRFDSSHDYAWVEGEDCFASKRIAVLADFVYYGGCRGNAAECAKPYTWANTSGVAAYPDAQEALELAVLELLERHAFMMAWLHGISTPAISLPSTPAAIQKRIGALRDVGFDVILKDYSFVGIPVVFVFAQSATQTLTRVGACAAYDAEAALDHALSEVEAGVAVQLAVAPVSKIAPTDVRMPAHHAALYAQQKYFRCADHLAAFDDTTMLRDTGSGCARNWQSLCGLLEVRDMPLLKFELGRRNRPSESAATPGLHVIRAIVPGLVSMSFGYGTEPLATSALIGPASSREQNRSNRARSLFPHPFA